MSLRAIAIDDEPIALQVVTTFAKRVPFLDLVDTFDSPFEAQPMLEAGDIDLLFLDINMPDLSGIEFLRSLAQPPLVIFTTAYEQYALEGFELDAVDYLLKPYAFERFLKAVTKAKKMKGGVTDASQEPTTPTVRLPTAEDYIFVKVEHQTVRIPLDKLLFVEGQKDYLKLYLEDRARPVMTLKSMRSMVEVLQPFGFLRIHRSYLIPVHRLDSFKKNQVQIGEHTLPIGDTYQATFQEKVVKGGV
ncbi:MAG TPA: DNA-binding response regulator [Cytophagales bacterium]|nr:DNA-binding response regulator [Cytophagales bacterium]HAA23455.1 DNA-binding response regulator [Cytophagales bacterium]HAP60669.1 DNA-binding response regulator [Cytophagales bacterium]